MLRSEYYLLKRKIVVLEKQSIYVPKFYSGTIVVSSTKEVRLLYPSLTNII